MATQAEIQRLRDELAVAEAATSPFVENGNSPAARQRSIDAFNALERALNEAPTEDIAPVTSDRSAELDGGLTAFAAQIVEERAVNRPTATGVAYDEEGKLLPGYELTEENNPVFTGNGIDAGAQTGAETSDSTQSSNGFGIKPGSGGFGLNPGRSSGVPFGATKSSGPGAQAQWSAAKDLRVKLRVPNDYLKGPSAGPANIIQKNGGILFPYTPTIAMDNQAQYATQTPLHSIYPLNFYKNSTLSPITVTAKFTVQNEFEGAVLLGVIHLLRSLTKMKFGNDPDAGSPPPVCRFDAYGDYMMYNVPVAISSWRHELPDTVDYIAVGRPGSPTTYGRSMVPVMSTIAITMNVMYSRREMLAYNVKDWLSGSLARRGYL
jgi:hypothetical protein